MKINIRLSLLGATRHDEQTKLYVGFCPALKVYSQGRTEEEAKRALESTLRLYVETCYERKILDEELSKAGFVKVSFGESIPPQEACKEYIMIQEANFDRVFDVEIPLELVAVSALGGHNARSGSRST
jgi:predicted RNase H-like HicB family nuclease